MPSGALPTRLNGHLHLHSLSGTVEALRSVEGRSGLRGIDVYNVIRMFNAVVASSRLLVRIKSLIALEFIALKFIALKFIALKLIAF